MIHIQRRHTGKRSFIFLVLSTLIVLLAGTLTLLAGQRVSSRADAGYVVGPPTLPAATVDQIFTRMGSPMVGTGVVVEQAARNANIDDAFALAVWWTETNDGAAGVGLADRNPGSVRGNPGYPAAFDGYTIYPSYAAAINDWFTLLRNRYVNRGLTSAYTICYPYVGTTGAASWAGKVVNLMLRYHGEEPAPVAAAPTSAPAPVAPIATATAAVHTIPTPLPKAVDAKKHADDSKPVKAMPKEHHRPVNIGQAQNISQGNGRLAPPVPKAGSGSVHTSEIFPAHIQQILIVLVLLAAILAVLPSICLRRKERGRNMGLAGETVMSTTEGLETEIFLPLYMNEYSPVGRMPEEWDGRVMEALKGETVEMRVPATPMLSGIGTVPLTPFVERTERRYSAGRRGEMGLKRARLVPMGSADGMKRGVDGPETGQLRWESKKE